MKNLPFRAILAFASLLAVGHAADPAPPSLLTRPSADQELAALITQVKARLDKGGHTEADLAAELRQFDALLAEHKGEKSEAVAAILVMKAQLFVEIFDEPEKGIELFRQLKADFPATTMAKEVDGAIAQITQQAEAEKVSRALKPGTLFPAFADKTMKDLDGQPLSLDRFKGKVLLVDFWATWCGPCVEEMPHVIATYKKHHADGFEIVGVSLDREGDKDKLIAFMKKNDMTWPQFYDGKYWENALSVQYGVHAIPTSYLLDGEGHILGKELRGEALEKAVAAALKK